jgi:hypothetical protein
MLKPTSDTEVGTILTTPSDSSAATARNIAIFEALQKAGFVTVIHVGEPRLPSADTGAKAVPTNDGAAL